MLARLLASVLAVAMVAGAIAYRSSRDAGGGGADKGVIVCARELGRVCDAVPGAQREPASETADRLAGVATRAEADVVAWLAPGPWAAMVDEQRRQAPLFDRSEVLGTTNLVAVIRKGQPITGCESEVTWRCLGDAAQDPAFRIAGAPPDEAYGLFVRAAALGGLLGPDYFINDVEDEALGWLSNLNDRLAAAPRFGATSLQQFLVIPGSARAYLTSAASSAQLDAKASADVATPAPVATVGATLVTVKGASVDRKALATALAAAGWEAGPVSGDDGLPSPGVLLALRELLR